MLLLHLRSGSLLLLRPLLLEFLNQLLQVVQLALVHLLLEVGLLNQRVVGDFELEAWHDCLSSGG